MSPCFMSSILTRKTGKNIRVSIHATQKGILQNVTFQRVYSVSFQTPSHFTSTFSTSSLTPSCFCWTSRSLEFIAVGGFLFFFVSTSCHLEMKNGCAEINDSSVTVALNLLYNLHFIYIVLRGGTRSELFFADAPSLTSSGAPEYSSTQRESERERWSSRKQMAGFK